MGRAGFGFRLGSEMDATSVLRTELPRLVEITPPVASLLDAPCGDAGWINSTNLGVHLIGVDIVPSLIERLQVRAGGGRNQRRISSRRYHPRRSCPDVTRSFARDALVHLSFANIEHAVANFRVSGAAWLIVTTFPECRPTAIARTATGAR